MSIEQKISELLAESKKLKTPEVISEEVKEMGSQGGPSTKATDKAATAETTNLPAATKEEEENNKRNATQKQDAGAPGKSNNVANAKATSPEASNISSVKEDIDALMFGEDLSEDFKAKATTIFEAAVLSRVTAEAVKLQEEYQDQLAEEVESIKEGLVEKVDGYLGYITEQWMSDNELALESGMKSEIMESFIDGMRSLFTEHYIDVPEEKFNVMEDMAARLQELEAKLNEQVEKNVELSKGINEQNRVLAVEEVSSGLTDTESEKFKALAEELVCEDIPSFNSKLQTIRENYFGKKVTAKVSSVVSDSPVETLNEDAFIDPSVKKYLSVLNNLK